MINKFLLGTLVALGALTLAMAPGCQGSNTGGDGGAACHSGCGGCGDVVEGCGGGGDGGGGCGGCGAGCSDGCGAGGCGAGGCGAGCGGCGDGCGCGAGCGGCGDGCGGGGSSAADTRHAKTLVKAYRTFKKTNATAFTSKPHKRHKVHNWVNKIGLKTFTSGKGDYRPGAVVVKEGWSKGKRSWFWIMEKRGAGYDSDNGDWYYAMVSAGGSVKMAGRIGACADCHSNASNDFVFGNPK